MGNKKLIVLIGIVSIAIIALLEIKLNFYDNVKKIKADITYPTENGLAFNCNKTSLLVGEEATCVLVGHYNGGIETIEGIFTSGDYISIESINRNKNIFTGEAEASYLTDETTPADFEIATVKIKGVSVGIDTLSYTGVDDEDDSTIDKINISYNDFANEAQLDDATITINVTNSSDEPVTELSSVNTLESLTISSGTLSPSFQKNTYAYSTTVSNDVTSINVNATKTDSKSVVDGLGIHNLSEGENKIEIHVAAENGSIATYTITVIREAKIDDTKSSDNTLKSLTIKNVTLSPVFSSSTMEYTATVENNITKLELKADVNDEKATVEVSDNIGNLVEGNNTILVKVTAEDNSVKTYTIVVNRKSINNNNNCKLELTSAAYKIDNTKLVIDAVNKDDTIETIRKNISSKCGTILVSNDNVVLSNGNEVKKYTINRVFVPKTGQNPVKYVAIIIGIGVIIGALIFIKRKMDK